MKSKALWTLTAVTRSSSSGVNCCYRQISRMIGRKRAGRGKNPRKILVRHKFPSSAAAQDRWVFGDASLECNWPPGSYLQPFIRSNYPALSIPSVLSPQFMFGQRKTVLKNLTKSLEVHKNVLPYCSRPSVSTISIDLLPPLSLISRFDAVTHELLVLLSFQQQTKVKRV